MNSKIKRWELAGVIFMVAFGASPHFVFEWTNYWRPAAFIAAVNESTRERFKIAFWPSFAWAVIENLAPRSEIKNPFIAKAAGFLLMPLVTAVLFYGYTSITGQHFQVIDIIIFTLSVIAGQLVSTRLMLRKTIKAPWLKKLATGILVLMVNPFATLSYYPRWRISLSPTQELANMAFFQISSTKTID